jgi:hypothetical protein
MKHNMQDAYFELVNQENHQQQTDSWHVIEHQTLQPHKISSTSKSIKGPKITCQFHHRNVNETSQVNNHHEDIWNHQIERNNQHPSKIIINQY